MIRASSPPRAASPLVRPPGPADADWRILTDLVGELLQSGEPGIALEVAQTALAEAPEDGNLHFLYGQALAAAGRRPEALAELAQALWLGTESEVLDLVAKIAFPGPAYRDNLAWLHRLLRPATYLEIGVFKGETLRLARPGTQAIGVDPAPLPESDRSYDAPTTLHRLTSDAYFAAVAAGEIASPGPVGLSFIDGLHIFEQVLRDFINVERHAGPDTLVVLHDTLPVAPAAAARDRCTSFWCGDTWKVVPCLRRFRPDLSLLTIPTHPSGLTLVAGLDPHSTVLADRFDAAVAAFIEAPLPPPLPEAGIRGDVANNQALIRAWLAASPVGPRIAAEAG